MTHDELDRLARRARRAHLEHLDLLSVALTWAEMPDLDRERWRRIAEAVIRAQVPARRIDEALDRLARAYRTAQYKRHPRFAGEMPPWESLPEDERQSWRELALDQ